MVLVVKTLERAVADNDRVHAVIRNIGISADGRGRSLWARKEGQHEAVRRAYGDQVSPTEVQYIETHATSTQIGDATEIEALAEFFGGHFGGEARLPIGSVKSNIGHTLETAGLAGLLKVVLAMHAREIPASIHVRSLNPSIDWDRIPFAVNRRRRKWPVPADGGPRTAAVNAFGIGGLNVHVVVSQHDLATVSSPAAGRRRPRRKTVAAAPAKYLAAQRQASPHVPIAIIGRGVVLPDAQNVEQFWQLLAGGQDAFSDVPADRWNAAWGYRPGQLSVWHTTAQRGGFIRDYVYDWQHHNIPPKQIALANPLQFMLLDAADQALRESGYDRRPFDRQRAAVIVGTVFGGDFGSQLGVGFALSGAATESGSGVQDRGCADSNDCRDHREIARDRRTERPRCGTKPAASPAARWHRDFQDVRSDGGRPGLGCRRRLVACCRKGAASDMLRSGACDMVLCARPRLMDLPSYEAFSLSGVLSAAKPAIRSTPARWVLAGRRRGPAAAQANGRRDPRWRSRGGCAAAWRRRRMSKIPRPRFKLPAGVRLPPRASRRRTSSSWKGAAECPPRTHNLPTRCKAITAANAAVPSGWARSSVRSATCRQHTG